MAKSGAWKERPVVRRYTDLAAAMNILQTRTLTLTDPSRWDDGNDRYGMAEFKRREGLQTLLAMCFATCSETYHHWRVFTEGKSGVCFEIDKVQLLAKLDTLGGFQHRSVDYRNLNILKGNPHWDLADLPFIKRAPYEPEKELRVIYCSTSECVDVIPIPIDLDWIKTIKLSPWMPAALHSAVRETLRGIDGCSRLAVQSTSLIGSETWKRWVDGAQ